MARLKIGKKFEHSFPKIELTSGHQAHQKMLSITSHWGNAN